MKCVFFGFHGALRGFYKVGIVIYSGPCLENRMCERLVQIYRTLCCNYSTTFKTPVVKMILGRLQTPNRMQAL